MAARPALSRELSLLAACCRWPGGAARMAAVREAAAAPLDWTTFQHLAEEHRVALQAAQAIREAGVTVPADVAERMREHANEATRRGLAMTRESLRIQRAFDGAAIPLAFLKGVSLSVLAYRGPAVREAKDIDVLVAPEEAAVARRKLEALGYEMIDPPGLDDDGFARLTRFAKDCTLYSRESRTLVELHWRLVQNDRLLEQLNPADLERVAMGGGALTTLTRPALIAYLCVHGAQHAWFRLRWSADIAAILASLGEASIVRVRDEAVALGAGRSADVAFLLCHELFGTALPETLLGALRADRTVRALVRNAIWCISHADGARALSFHPLGLRSRLARYFTAPGIGFAWREFRQGFVSVEDRLQVVLPDRLAFLYPLLRLPLWMQRRARRLFARQAP